MPREYQNSRQRNRSSQQGWKKLLKLVLDRLLAAVALVILSPVILLIAAILALTLGRPILFRQSRPGFHGRPFTFLKFRTMRDTTDASGTLLPDEQRLTVFGRMLRSWSLDELPQLWNVLRGDLSLVGPRPLLNEYLQLYTDEQRRRHDVMPGITGWTQVNGRNALGWEEKFALDLWYVDNWSLRLDMQILLRTLKSVFQRTGISQAGHATMPKFLGKSND